MVGFRTDGNSRMRTRRPLSINNSLVHGICNYDCQTCGVNKKSYRGPRAFQPLAVTGKLIARVEEAAAEGIRVRYLANSGDGEPTLHPEFPARMDLFGRMIREWSAPGVPAPEVSVVTNGARLLAPGILDAVSRNDLTLIVSLPTVVPENYGQLVFGRPERGAGLLAEVVPGIEAAMRETAAGRIPRLCFHLSPPDRDVVRKDFPRTVEFLAAAAARAGLKEVELILFPATSNRSGLVRSRSGGVDFHPDLFKAWNGRRLGGVRVRMSISYRRFFPKLWVMLDLVRSFSLPCLWNAHLFITAGGESICCNDQAVRAPRGSVLTDSIATLMIRKEAHLPGEVCAGCDQRPDRMRGGLLVKAFSLMARGRLAMARLGAGERRREAGDVVVAEEVRPVVEDGAARGAMPAALPGSRNRLLTTMRPRASPPHLPAVAGGGRASLTEHLRALEALVAGEPAAPERFSFGDGRYTIRVANDLESRRKAYQLVYRLYLEKEYAKPNPSRMWLSMFDALPETATLLVERADTGSAVGSLTVVFDSPMGLPADGLYRSELDALRASGRRIAEVISLAVAEEAQAGSQVLVKLFNLAYFVARGIRGSTDFVVTVNPRHVRFYERLMLFAEAGPERSYGKVGGAPAQLLRLDLDVAERQRDPRFAGQNPRSIYGQFRAVREEPATVAALSRELRPMTERERGYFFVAETDLLADATPEQRARVLSG